MNNWIQTWLNVITRPGEPVFAEERQRPDANLSTALIWMAIAAVVSGVIALLQGWLFRAQLERMGGMSGMLSQFGIPQEQLDQLPSFMPFIGSPGVGFGAAFTVILSALIGFLILVGLFHLTARLLGGTGEFGRYAYLIAAFHAPLSVVTSLLGLVPLAGGCLGLLLIIYEVVLAYFATRVEHGLPQGKAIMVVLIPIIVLMVLIGCFAFLVGGLVAGIMTNQ